MTMTFLRNKQLLILMLVILIAMVMIIFFALNASAYLSGIPKLTGYVIHFS